MKQSASIITGFEREDLPQAKIIDQFLQDPKRFPYNIADQYFYVVTNSHLDAFFTFIFADRNFLLNKEVSQKLAIFGKGGFDQIAEAFFNGKTNSQKIGSIAEHFRKYASKFDTYKNFIGDYAKLFDETGKIFKVLQLKKSKKKLFFNEINFRKYVLQTQKIEPYGKRVYDQKQCNDVILIPIKNEAYIIAAFTSSQRDINKSSIRVDSGIFYKKQQERPQEEEYIPDEDISHNEVKSSQSQIHQQRYQEERKQERFSADQGGKGSKNKDKKKSKQEDSKKNNNSRIQKERDEPNNSNKKKQFKNKTFGKEDEPIIDVEDPENDQEEDTSFTYVLPLITVFLILIIVCFSEVSTGFFERLADIIYGKKGN